MDLKTCLSEYKNSYLLRFHSDFKLFKFDEYSSLFKGIFTRIKGRQGSDSLGSKQIDCATTDFKVELKVHGDF